jgi:hypothetical protein
MTDTPQPSQPEHQPDPDHLVEAAGHLSSALNLIDRLGEFFEAEHTWLRSRPSLGGPLDTVGGGPLVLLEEDATQASWEAMVTRRLDYLGFVVPEMYESLIHLAHGLQSVILEIGAIGEVGEGFVP